MKKPAHSPPSQSAAAATERSSASARQKASQPEARTATKSRNGAAGNGGSETELDAQQVLAGLVGLKKGDFSVRLPLGWCGVGGKVADTFNDLAELMNHWNEELSRVSEVVGKEGKIQERLSIGHASGAWSDRVNSVNTLIGWLAHPVSATASLIGAAA